MKLEPAIWFPAIRCGSGADVFTENLCAGLHARGIRAEITWLPHRAEYAPWSVQVPRPPQWANIVHVNSWLPMRFLPKGLPVVTTLHSCVHDSALEPYKGFLQRCYHRLWIRQVEAANLARADRIVAVSRYTAEQARRCFGLAEVEVIHNGIDIQRFHPIERKAPNTPFRLLYVGNWDRRKGVDLLAPIMQALGEGFELVYTADREGRHRRYPLPPNCRCLGRLSGESLVRAYQEADALLFPSRLEGLPLTAIEAMACGLPVIAARASSLPEVVEDGASGWLCDVDDVAGFAAVIRALASAPEAWHTARAKARARAQGLFSLTAFVQAWMWLYAGIVASS